jgi:hypothetical protein
MVFMVHHCSSTSSATFFQLLVGYPYGLQECLSFFVFAARCCACLQGVDGPGMVEFA